MVHSPPLPSPGFLAPLFEAQSLLVIGASDRPGNLAGGIVHNLLDARYPGEITLFGRRPGNLFGHRIRTSFAEVPAGVDLAVLLVPAAEAIGVLDQCGRHGIRFAVVETGGFAELDSAGRDAERELRAVAARHGLRFTGPNGLGIVDPRSRLVLPFMHLPALPRPGRIHLLIQSGGVGVYLLNRFTAENLGVGSFVSLGNKLDLDECDLLDHLRAEQPQAVCIYLEDIRDGRRFFAATRDYPCPILIQKANVSRAGAQAAASHTAAVAVDDRLLDAALRQNGVTRVREMKGLVQRVKAFALPPLGGDRLLIVSRSGGHAVVAADLAERHGFILPPLEADLAAAVRAGQRAKVVGLSNPLDLGDVFDFDVYRQVVERSLAAGELDGVVCIHTYGAGPEEQPSRRLIHELARLVTAHGKPIFTCLLCTDAELATVRQQVDLPIFDSPEEALAAAALSRQTVARQTRDPARLLPLPLPPYADADRVTALVDAGAPGLLPGDRALELVAALGLPVAPARLARNIDEIEALAAEVGFPLVLKLLHPALPHKSDLGGVVLDVTSGAEARQRAAGLWELAASLAPDQPPEGVLLQRLKRGFREVFLGGRRDPSFGPVVLVGLGGVLVEVFQDVAIRLAPLAAADLDELLAEPVSFKALRGARNVPPGDLPWLREAILRVSRLLLDHPRVQEIDINPIKLHRVGRGGTAVDARVVLGPREG
ncbi:MAG: acetate--CoA ligase family protein [Myxococcota bacterium]|jgi:acetyltransferase|nr:acetate--CoA ligase family protein [Myxococcota bacterium]